MKKILLLFIFYCFILFNSQGQNLVPNGNFETFTACPDGYTEITYAIPWNVPTIICSSDYYNQCATNPSVGVPTNNATGYQIAHSGVAYGGIYIYYGAIGSREYIEAPLNSTLIANQCYHFEMFVNLYNGSGYTASSIGTYFSDTAVTGITIFTALPYVPQIGNTIGNMFDTLNWIPVIANYTAHGGENFLIIGNFNDNTNTDTMLINSAGNPYSYVYIDDVCLTPCGSSCTTGIEEQNANTQINIFPNPATTEFQISNFNFQKGDELRLTDALGKIIFTKKIPAPIANCQLPIANFPNGIYFLQIKTKEGVWNKKVVLER